MSGLKRQRYESEERKIRDSITPSKRKSTKNSPKNIKKQFGLSREKEQSKSITKDKSVTLDTFVIKNTPSSKDKTVDEIFDICIRKLSIDELIKYESQLKLQSLNRKVQKENRIPSSEVIACKEMYQSLYIMKRQKKQILDPKSGTYDKKSNEFKYKTGTVYLKLIDEYKLLKTNLQMIKRQKQSQQNKIITKRTPKKNLALGKQSIQRQQSYYEKQMRHLEKQLAKQKNVNDYQRIKCKLAWKQNRCYFSRLQWPIYRNRYQILQLIGSGGFGEVYRVFDHQTLEQKAIKLNFIEYNSEDSMASQGIRDKKKHIYREIQVHKGLNHPRITKYYDTYQIQQYDRLVVVSIMQICLGQDLNEYIKQGYLFTQKEALTIIKQTLEALAYLNSLQKKVIHYDLKPHNILYYQGSIKIIDFGLCKTLQQDLSQIQLTSIGTGTMFYLPPQTFQTIVMNQHEQNEFIEKKRMVSTSIDMWAVGVIFYQLMYGARPFGQGMNQQQIYSSGMMKKQLKLIFPSIRNRSINQDIKDFITECFKDQNNRITAEKGLKHACFKNVQ